MQLERRHFDAFSVTVNDGPLPCMRIRQVARRQLGGDCPELPSTLLAGTYHRQLPRLDLLRLLLETALHSHRALGVHFRKLGSKEG